MHQCLPQPFRRCFAPPKTGADQQCGNAFVRQSGLILYRRAHDGVRGVYNRLRADELYIACASARRRLGGKGGRACHLTCHHRNQPACIFVRVIRWRGKAWLGEPLQMRIGRIDADVAAYHTPPMAISRAQHMRALPLTQRYADIEKRYRR